MKRLEWGAVFAALMYLFLYVPFFVVILASFSDSAYITFPPKNLSIRWYQQILVDGRYLPELWASAKLGVLSTLMALVVGVPASVAVARYNFPGRDFIASVVLAPLMVPVVLIAVALLRFYSTSGIGLNMPSLVMAHTVMTTPYVVRTVTGTLQAFEASLEEAAMSLGAHRLRAFWEITVPTIMPGVFSGAMFAFITSFGDSVVSLFLSSPATVTLPVRIFTDILWNFEPGIAAISTVSSLLAIGAVILVYAVQGTRAFLGRTEAKVDSATKEWAQ